MGIISDLGKAGAAIAGNVLLDLAEGTGLFKARKEDPDDGTELEQDEGTDRAPGGDAQDTASNAPVPVEEPNQDPKTLFWDPYAIVEQLGFKDKPSAITYGTLKAMRYRCEVVQAIIHTRTQQVAAFSSVSHSRYDLGFRIKMREQEKTPNSRDMKWCRAMETLIERTGVTEQPRGRDNFETFLRKLTQDSYTYDQMCLEIVPNRKGQPAQWYAVDAATIRLANSANAYLHTKEGEAVKYVQVYDGMVINEYSVEELAFGVRNPSTDVRLYGYGVSELEMLIRTVTALLWGFEYNERAFSQGSAQKGLLNIKGTIPEKQLRSFRRHWYNMLSGVHNAWRTPILNSDEVQWVSMHASNRDMEYNAWIDFQIKIACALFTIDPVEINFQYGNVGQSSTLSDPNNNREKITQSRERGLRPMLRFLAQIINQHIIWPTNEDFEFAFVGLDARTPDEIADRHAKLVKSVRTIDELRAEDDLPALPDKLGEVILDPQWMAAYNAKNAQAQQQPGQEGQQPGDEGQGLQSLLQGADDTDQQQDGEQPAGEQKDPDGIPDTEAGVQKSMRVPSRRASSRMGLRSPRFKINLRL